MNNPLLLQCDQLCKRYQEGNLQTDVLQNVSFTLQPGEMTAIVGSSGSGKSTLLHLLGGLDSPTSGDVLFKGQSLNQMSSSAKAELRNRELGFIYQFHHLLPDFTALENVAMPLLIGKKNSSEALQRATEMLAAVGLDKRASHRPSELSGGERQRVAIARALVNQSKLIILDEPTTALTRSEINNLFAILRQLKQQGIAFIFISHKLNELLEICDRVTVMRDGKVIDCQPTEKLTSGDIENLMLGYALTFETRASSATDDVLLSVRHLSKRNSFQDVSFELRKGEVLGIAGVLGAGRTELAMALFGVEPAQSGEIYLHGKPVTINSIHAAVKHGIAYVPEDRLAQGLIMEQSIAANAAICTLDHYLTPMRLLNSQKMRDTVEELLKGMQVKYGSQDQPIRMLSGGNQQKVVLAKWLAMRPQVFILDSPTVGIDVGAKNYIYQTVKAKAQEGMGIIFISDELPELLANCNRIIMMQRGRLGKSWRSDEIDNETLQHEMERQ